METTTLDILLGISLTIFTLLSVTVIDFPDRRLERFSYVVLTFTIVIYFILRLIFP